MLTGCRYWGIDYVPQPQIITNKEQAKAILYKAFDEQPKEFGAKELVIDDIKITFLEKYSHKSIYYTTPDRYEMRKHLRTGLYIQRRINNLYCPVLYGTGRPAIYECV